MTKREHSGEWDNEPDSKEWEYRGISCKMLRNFSGCWCGYAKIDSSYKLYNVEEDSLYLSFDVHGGITYSELNSDGDRWIGFDCSHYGDLIPDLHISDRFADPVYRNEKYVTEQVQSLVDQIIDGGKNTDFSDLTQKIDRALEI